MAALEISLDIAALVIICMGMVGARRGWPNALLLTAVGNFVIADVWWWRRRRRKRSARLVGAKSRALIAAMVARMRESAKPRRVLRPVPGGAS